MNWGCLSNWFKKAEIVIEVDPNSTPYLRATYALLDRNITVCDYVWLFKIPARQGRKNAEQPIEASKSEIKRWCDAGNVHINGASKKWEEKVEFPVVSFHLFQKGNRVSIF